MNIFKYLFPRFEDQSVQIKLEFESWDQEYEAICGYKCIAYWKLSSNWRWKKIGVVDHRKHNGKINKITDELYDEYLNTAKRMVQKELEGKTKKGKRMLTIPVSEFLSEDS